jgi:hypothetical protein
VRQPSPTEQNRLWAPPMVYLVGILVSFDQIADGVDAQRHIPLTAYRQELAPTPAGGAFGLRPLSFSG